MAPGRLFKPVSPLNAQFTISSAPEDPFISVHIRQVGDFTQALAERLGVTPVVTKPSVGERYDPGRRGEWLEVVPTLGRPMPLLRVDG